MKQFNSENNFRQHTHTHTHIPSVLWHCGGTFACAHRNALPCNAPFRQSASTSRIFAARTCMQWFQYVNIFKRISFHFGTMQSSCLYPCDAAVPSEYVHTNTHIHGINIWRCLVLILMGVFFPTFVMCCNIIESESSSSNNNDHISGGSSSKQVNSNEVIHDGTVGV